jgi:hypothetical protein
LKFYAEFDLKMATQPQRSAIFENFDEKSIYEKARDLAKSQSCKNFVLDFDAGEAFCALDLDKTSLKTVLDYRKEDIKWRQIVSSAISRF